MTPCRVLHCLAATAALVALVSCSGGGDGGDGSAGTGVQTTGGAAQSVAPAVPMDTREALVSVLGTPDAVSGKIVVVDDLEMWVESLTDADLAVRFDVASGVVIGSEAIDPFPEGTLLPLHVRVQLGMSQAEVRDSLAGFELTEVQGTVLDLPVGSVVLAGGQVLVGLFEDRVVYYQTYPLVPDVDGEFQAYLDGDLP
ncbi:MAG: hypothetical protein IPP16_10350 [Acidimicrobiaceae bacterium]|nr:hypothetical protein [Acidimicrobiaceae bacterium]